MHLIGPLQVPKCDSDLIQLMQVSIYRNLQVYTETCLTLHLYYSRLATPAYARRHGAGYARQNYTQYSNGNEVSANNWENGASSAKVLE